MLEIGKTKMPLYLLEGISPAVVGKSPSKAAGFPNMPAPPPTANKVQLFKGVVSLIFPSTLKCSSHHFIFH